MGNRAKHQQALINAAARLFRRKGYAGTSTGDILKLSGAPRGSLYYYYPGGKEELGAAAVASAGALVTKTLKKLTNQAANPSQFIDLYTSELSFWLDKSGFEDGCPIATTLLEIRTQSDLIANAGRQTFEDWAQVIADFLGRHGYAADAAKSKSVFIISAIEGALMLAKADLSVAPVVAAGSELKAFFQIDPQGQIALSR